MENQHRKIKGYRELSQAEIDLMNRIKEQGLALEELVQKVREHVAGQRDACRPMESEQMVEECQRLNDAEPERWVQISKTNFQEGLMALTRAVAQPGFF